MDESDQVGWSALAKIENRAAITTRALDARQLSRGGDDRHEEVRGRNDSGRIAISRAQLAFARVGRHVGRSVDANHGVAYNQGQQQCDA